MRRFPRREAEVVALAGRILAGLTHHTEDFPSPPIVPEDLEVLLKTYQKARADVVQAKAAVAAACREKDNALASLVDAMKLNLRYAEYAAKGNQGKLTKLGWRKRKTASNLAPPGQTRNLTVKREGKGWISLDWKRPNDGGTVATYQVQLKNRESGEWSTVELCFDTETVLTGQARDVEVTYRIVAINKAGEGISSNEVTAYL